MRHLEGAELWIQQVVRSKRLTVVKINGKANPADLFTKYLNAGDITRNMSILGFELQDEWGNEVGKKKLNMELNDVYVSAIGVNKEEEILGKLPEHSHYLENENRVFYEDNNKKYKKEDDKDRAPHEGDEARVRCGDACKDSRKDILNEGKLKKDKVI